MRPFAVLLPLLLASPSPTSPCTSLAPFLSPFYFLAFAAGDAERPALPCFVLCVPRADKTVPATWRVGVYNLVVWLPRGVLMCTITWGLAALGFLGAEEEVRKTVFLSALYIKKIILPRQVRDKHRESSFERPFCAGGALLDAALRQRLHGGAALLLYYHHVFLRMSILLCDMILLLFPLRPEAAAWRQDASYSMHCSVLTWNCIRVMIIIVMQSAGRGECAPCAGAGAHRHCLR